MTRDAIQALARDQDVFVSGDRLAYVRRSTTGRNGTTTARIESHTMASMRASLSRLIHWQKAERPSKRHPDEVIMTPTRPPDDVVAAVLAPQDWPGINPLDLVTHAPSLLPGLSVTETAGYHRAGRLLFVPRRPIGQIPDCPSLDECRAALDLLLEALADFPFQTEADRSAAVAAILTLIAEPAISGNIPLIALDANTPGSGKGLLASVITRIGIDDTPALLAGNAGNEEMQKTLHALASSGQRVVILDNIADVLRLPSLDAALTSGHLSHRVLGTNIMRTVPFRLVVLATGNNLSIGGDTMRRTVFIRLRTTLERPEERGGFRHDPLDRWIADNLPGLQRAAITILKGFVAAQMPQTPGLAALGAFEGWSSLIRHCLLWLGLPDPLDTRREMRLVSDPVDQARRALVTGWPMLDPERKGLLARQVISLLFGAQEDPAHADLREAIETLVNEKNLGASRCTPDANRLGRVLGSIRGRRYTLDRETYWLEPKAGNSNQGQVWLWHSSPKETTETSETSFSQAQPPRNQEEENLFSELEGKETSPTSPRLLQTPYIYIISRDEAVRILNEAALSCSQGMIVGATLEPKSLSPLTSRPRLLQIAAPDRPVAVIDLDQVGGLSALAEHLRPLRAVAHDAVLEMGFLRHHGGLDLTLDCTMLAEHVLTGKSRSLAEVLRDRLGLTVEGSTEFQASGWSGDLSPEQLQYAAASAEAPRQLFPFLQAELERLGATRAYELAREAQPAVVSMALAGVPIDHEEVERLLAEVQPQQAAAEARAREIFGPAFNIRSSTQLEQLLIEGLPPEMIESWPQTPKGVLQTGTKVLAKYIPDFPEPLRSHFRNVILPYKALLPLKQALPHYNVSRVYPHTNILGAPTGRMSCSGPNMQGLPGALRSIVRAPEGHRLVLADYSQIEFLIANALAGDQAVLDAFARGVDVHISTAAAIRGCSVDEIDPKGRDRRVAKAANYGLLYGQGAAGFRAYASQNYGVTLSPDEAARVRESWFAAYPRIREYQNRLMEEWQDGHLLQSPMGRPLYPTKYTEALNYPAQAAGAEIIHAALGFVHRNLAQFGGKVVPILAVHDEIVLLAPVDEADAAARVLEESMAAAALSVLPDLPSKGLVEAKVGVTWADKN